MTSLEARIGRTGAKTGVGSACTVRTSYRWPADTPRAVASNLAYNVVNSFDYHSPGSLEEAFGLLEQYGEDAHLMAGGTALVLLLQQGLVQPGHVVGLRGVAELQGIRRLDNGGLQIRAMATHRQAEISQDVKAYCPA